ncbi:MobQ family relaxase [Rhodomicrobium udaipurense]|uniref:MobQ family relaxase n=1 Tax=Rhodomicrobium udaipurense TaxID=1202716 RepID=UPI00138DEAE3
MAVYHFEAQIISRNNDGRRRSVVAVAAYRAAERLEDRRQGIVFDYRAKQGVVHQEILLPEGAASWLGNRETLWNHAEKLEKRRDAQLAREFNISLPHELTPEQRLALIRGFVMEEFVARGMVADLALHDPLPGESDARHFHAHVLLTLRAAHGNGLARVKTRAWNSDALLMRWRQQWAFHANRALELAGHDARIDHRALLDQRDDALRRGDENAARSLDRLPQIAVGPEAVARHRRGVAYVPKQRPMRKRRPDENPERASRIERNRQILRTNARKAQAYSAWFRYRVARLEQRKLRWERMAARKMSEEERAQRDRITERRKAFDRLSFAHCLHRLGLLTTAQLKAARLAAWATLEEAQRLEVERRFAKRVAEHRRREAKKRLAGRARRRRASDPKGH